MKGLKILNKKGITLLALVITIAILIIISGIIISTTLGEKGLINFAKRKAGEYTNLMEKEEQDIKDLYSKLKIAVDGETTIDYETLKTVILDSTYPVGSIYITIDDTNPSVTLGGTWESFGQGQTLVGVNPSETEFNSVEKTGGTKSESYTPAGTNSGGAVGNHTLTIAEMPSHTHTFQRYSGTDDSNFSGHIANAVAANDTGSGASTVTTSGSGSGGAHNHPFTQPTFTGTASTISHLQPYITCYMWKRTN